MRLDSAQVLEVDNDDAGRIEAVRADMLDEYRQDHAYPWIIGYSGGKDSTMVAHLVIEMLMSLPPSKRKRPVHIVANDTLVESPLIVRHIVESINEIEEAAQAFALPVLTKITQPAPDQSFWVNLIGRGYPSPNRSFRWCTDRMKIMPTSHYIKSQIDEAGQVILLLGVRRSESATRAASTRRYDNGERLNKHNDLRGCMVYRPIVELDTDEVWEFLALNNPPWGGSHLNLINLYRNANGGECPVVTQHTDIASCGTTSSRFGCWTCTVVDKDRSLEGFVESGYIEFGPLLDFRDWLASIRSDKERRQARRRDGRITITSNGKFVPGPFTIQTRTEILERLRVLEKEVGQSLVTDEEVALIYQIWTNEMASQGDTKIMNTHEIRRDK